MILFFFFVSFEHFRHIERTHNTDYAHLQCCCLCLKPMNICSNSRLTIYDNATKNKHSAYTVAYHLSKFRVEILVYCVYICRQIK